MPGRQAKPGATDSASTASRYLFCPYLRASEARRFPRHPSICKQLQIDAFAHRLIASIVRVQMVAAVKRGVELSGIGRVPRDLIEVDHRIEGPAGADPVVHGFANLLALV